MTFKEKGIEHKTIGGGLIASIRGNVQKPEEIQYRIETLQQQIPSEQISGNAFCIFHFLHSYPSGFDVEVGFPVHKAVNNDKIKTRLLPTLQVLSKVHEGSIETKAETSGVLYGCQTEYGLISDEFTIEVYLDDNALGQKTELQFVLHRWHELFEENTNRALAEDTAAQVLDGKEKLAPETSSDDRFLIIKNSVKLLDQNASEFEKYDILSNCSHIFPSSQIAKQKAVYEESYEEHGDTIKAVDAVIAFMDADPGWRAIPIREGNVLRITKRPANAQGYENAETKQERRRAYCFCPLIRDHLEEGMPDTFCHCSSGWFRKQWEGATGKPVRVEIVRSLLKGHDECEFAVTIPTD